LSLTQSRASHHLSDGLHGSTTNCESNNQKAGSGKPCLSFWRRFTTGSTKPSGLPRRRHDWRPRFDHENWPRVAKELLVARRFGIGSEIEALPARHSNSDAGS